MNPLRSFLFAIWFTMVTVVIYLVALPALLLPRHAMVHASRSWSRAVLFGLKAIAGLDCEIRGAIPDAPMLIASKHMSIWDTMALYLTLWDPAVVVKRKLLRVPFYGWYIAKAGVIAIDREAGASALRKMAIQAKAALAGNRSILIFPEGTRKSPGAPPDYKPGVAGLYGLLGVACAPVALNSGLFWTGPMGFLKRPGRIVVEFLDPIPPGLKRDAFMGVLERRIETATAKLVEEGRRLLASQSDAD